MKYTTHRRGRRDICVSLSQILVVEDAMRKHWKDLKRELMRDAEFVKEYEALGTEYELAAIIIAVRLSSKESSGGKS